MSFEPAVGDLLKACTRLQAMLGRCPIEEAVAAEGE